MLECVVPQSSCLGPLLFKTYTSKLFEILRSFLRMLMPMTRSFICHSDHLIAWANSKPWLHWRTAFLMSVLVWERICCGKMMKLLLLLLLQSNLAISKEDRMPLDLPFPSTLPRLFRSPAISNFFSFPLGLRNSGVRLYYYYYYYCYYYYYHYHYHYHHHYHYHYYYYWQTNNNREFNTLQLTWYNSLWLWR